MPRISKLLLVVVGLMLWRVFFPAIMSYDSIVQFRQAWEGRFGDWHPPLMALALHLFLKVGRNIGALMLVQCLAGLLGVRALALAWMEAFFSPPIPRRRAEGLALLVPLVLLLPVSPLPFYLMTFWKDSWSAVLLIWICAVSLRMVSEPQGEEGGRRRLWLRTFALLALAAALGLVRHNAIVALAVAGLVLGYALRRVSRTLAAASLAAPLLVFAVSEAAIDRVFAVEKVHLERHISRWRRRAPAAPASRGTATGRRRSRTG